MDSPRRREGRKEICVRIPWADAHVFRAEPNIRWYSATTLDSSRDGGVGRGRNRGASRHRLSPNRRDSGERTRCGTPARMERPGAVEASEDGPGRADMAPGTTWR